LGQKGTKRALRPLKIEKWLQNSPQDDLPKQGMLLNSTAQTKIFSVILRFQTDKEKREKKDGIVSL
jgi:hypothetical protein